MKAPNLSAIKLLIVAGALALRIGLAQGELALDEVWSLSLVRGLDQPLQLLSVREDNNHLLNSFYLFFIPQHAPFIAFRIASLAAGAVTLLFAAFVLPQAGLPLLVLVAFHPLFVAADSSARGYGLVLACSAAAVRLAADCSKRRRIRDVILLQAVLCAGLLAHLSFAGIYLGIMIWSLVERQQGRISWKRLAAMHGLPALTAAALYLSLQGRIELRGGNPRSYADVISSLLSSLTGLGNPNSSYYAGAALAAGVSVLIALLIARQLRELAEDPDNRGRVLFYIVSGVLFPAGMLAVFQPAIITERYFTSSLFALALVTAEILNKRSKAFAAAFLGLFLIGSAHTLNSAIRLGNGNFSALAAGLSADCPPKTVGGDHDFRIPLLLDYYEGRAGRERCRYVRREAWSSTPPQFMILHRPGRRRPPRDTFQPPGGPRYVRFESYEAGDLAGFSFYLYGREDEEAGSERMM